MIQTIYNYIQKNKDVCIFEIYDLYRCKEYEDMQLVENALDILVDKNLIEKYYYFNTQFFRIMEG